MSSLPACYQNKGLRSVFIKGRAYTVERTGKLHVLYLAACERSVREGSAA